MICDICGQIPEAFSRFDEIPFLDGNYYDIVCFTCASICREWEYDPHGNILWYGYKDVNRLATLQVMIKEGWDEHTAKCSIISVSKLIKNMKLNIKYNCHCPVFDALIGIE